jgi:tetratricopeptide (TPR) repeat protein
VRLVLSGLIAVLALPALLNGQPSGLGIVTFPTSGSPAAQAHFIVAVAWLHSFEYEEAIEEFRQAQTIDPRFAMAYWGEAMCYNQPLWFNENLSAARGVLARLGPTREARAAKAPTAREKAYLDAVEMLYGDGDKAVRDRRYSDAMGKLFQQFPADNEAGSFYALSLLGMIPEGQRNFDLSLKAGTIVDKILSTNPNHPGALHYALHAYDDGKHAAKGLAAARRYAKVAPRSSHALHMPSHIFMQLGMWDEAVSSDEASYAASVQWVARKGFTLDMRDYHSLSWLQYEYLQKGRYGKAWEALKPVQEAMAAQQGSSGSVARGVDHGHRESEIGRGRSPVALMSEFASMRARFVVESGRWEEMRGKGTFDNVDELFALGMSAIKLSDLGRAEAALEHLRNLVRSERDESRKQLSTVMEKEIDALMHLARHDGASAVRLMQEATTIERQLPNPVGRPYPIKPANELMGEVLLELKRPGEAAAQFQQALWRTPNRAASVIGLARAARDVGDHRTALATYRKFAAVWHAADADRPELKETRAFLDRPSSRVGRAEARPYALFFFIQVVVAFLDRPFSRDSSRSS